MAIMRQQANFVEQLYSSGMVDEQEQEQLLEPIEAQERRLERKGAVWRAPKIVEVGASSVIQIFYCQGKNAVWLCCVNELHCVNASHKMPLCSRALPFTLLP